MHVDVLIVEIGSTTTIVSAFTDINGDAPRLAGQGMGLTTVSAGDVTIGMNNALEDLKRNTGAKELTWDLFMASSSAAGGLKMTVHGLVYDMTVKAAREAALGAGAVLHFATSGPVSGTDLRKVREINPSIILLAGGVDYGEKKTIVENARRLASLGLKAPVIYAGNVAAGDEVTDIFAESGIKCRAVDNVYPRIDELNIDPTKTAIQDVFEEHITEAPGMENIRSLVKGRIIPTPGAVFNAARLLYREIGDLMVVDVGGATTDVHSVTEGSPEIREITVSPEPLAKRTVEGDLGLYVNAGVVLNRISQELLKPVMGELDPREILDRKKVIPEKEEEFKLTGLLCREAVMTAVQRHSGRIRYSSAGLGRKAIIAEGRDLTRVRWIIGTGGALVMLPFGSSLLAQIQGRRPGREMYPESAVILIDKDYIMPAAGVLALTHPEAALRILKNSLGIDQGECL
ncbi:MAG: GlmL-related ornithine degradation protein [Bacillota bacterium]